MRCGGFGSAGSLKWWMVGVGACLCGLAAAGGAAAQAPGDAEVPTLHAYTDLVQVPTLVLGEDLKPFEKIDERKFFVSFDGGPKFPVTHARLEGDDSLSVAILLDANRVEPKVVDEAIAKLAPLFLHATDAVSIYAMGCQVIQAPDEGATDAATLKRKVDLLLQRSDEKAKCQNPANVWDTMALVVQALSAKPGRRVILAVTDGIDRGSKVSVDALRHFAQAKSVAIFGFVPPQPPGTRGAALMEKSFGLVSLSSGGMLLEASENALGEQLALAVKLIRGRYILEFPRPMSVEDGQHSMAITIAGRDAFIRPAGASFPKLTPVALNDPNRIAPDPARLPQLGKSKPPSPKATIVSSISAVPQAQGAAPSKAPEVAVVSTASVAVTPGTQPSSGQPLSVPNETTLKVTTKLTIENVTVTDSKGHSVHGLTQADFTVKEDGKPQPIKNFEEYGTETPVAQAALPELPPNVYTNSAQPAAVTGTVNILMLDSLSTGLTNHVGLSPQYFMVARQQALKYLQEMPSGTEVAILELADGLRVVEGFTTDRALLLAAVNSTSSRPVARSYLIPPGSVAEFCAALNMQSQLALDALNQVTALVSGFKGKKNLIWFTPGIPWLTDYERFQRRFPKVPCVADYTPDLHKTYNELTTAQVALYPVDSRGVFSDPVGGAGTAGPPNPDTLGFLTSVDSDHESLTDMADATGGIAYMDRNDLAAATGEAIATGSDYYSVSYVPPVSKYDGKHHTINIQVSRPGLHLNYRKGYNSDELAQPARTAAKKDPATGPGVERSALSISMGRGVPTSSELQFDVRIEPDEKPSIPPVIGTLDPKLNSKSLTRYDVHYTIPVDHVTLANAPDGARTTAVILDIAAYDGVGNLVTFLSQPATLPLTAEEYKHLPAATLRCVQQIDLPSGQFFLRVGILDTASNKIGTLEIPLKVGR